jgi:hypothetical protein
MSASSAKASPKPLFLIADAAADVVRPTVPPIAAAVLNSGELHQRDGELVAYCAGYGDVRRRPDGRDRRHRGHQRGF